MRKLLYICMAGLLTLGCTKDKLVTTPCGFSIQTEWVKGSRAQFTVTPEKKNAYYCYGVMAADHPLYHQSDEEIIQFQLDWMNSDYANLRKEGKTDGDFLDMFCFQGTRTIKSYLLPPDMDHKLMVFQVNPQTCQLIGPIQSTVFHTDPIPEVELDFTIQYKDNMFRILPSDKNVTWFWEYEREDKVADVYEDPYYFFYYIIDMYDQYGFLGHSLTMGDDEWELPRDDRSIKEGVKYVMALSACTEDGEICSQVSYAEFVFENNKVSFTNADFPVEALN